MSGAGVQSLYSYSDNAVWKVSLHCLTTLFVCQLHVAFAGVIIAGSLEAAYSLNWGAQEIWGKGGGETLALLW